MNRYQITWTWLLVQINNKESISFTGPLWGESASNWWIPLTKGHLCGTPFLCNYFIVLIWMPNISTISEVKYVLLCNKFCGIIELHVKNLLHDDVIKILLYWPFVQGIHWSPVNHSHKGQWRGALMFSLICGRLAIWEATMLIMMSL